MGREARMRPQSFGNAGIDLSSLIQMLPVHVRILCSSVPVAMYERRVISVRHRTIRCGCLGHWKGMLERCCTGVGPSPIPLARSHACFSSCLVKIDPGVR